MTRFNDLMTIASKDFFDDLVIFMVTGLPNDTITYAYTGLIDYLVELNPVVYHYDFNGHELEIEEIEINRDNYKFWEVC